MSDFNYQEYLKNNPLLKPQVKEEILTESKEVSEMDIPDAVINKVNAGISGVKDMATTLLTFYNDVQDGENMDFSANPDMKVVISRLKKLAQEEDMQSETYDNYEEDDMKEEIATEAKELPQSIKDKEARDAEIEAKKAKGMIKVSELKAKIKEDIISILSEQDEDEAEEEVKDEIEVEDEVEVKEPALDAADAQAGLSKDEQEIQDSLKIAYDNALAIGDQKLADQIGNSITFFTRSHVVER
tara:strand:+ start:1270 stop:1998 length:729 start_codon:yes stop_codon:yes gene_type:complete